MSDRTVAELMHELAMLVSDRDRIRALQSGFSDFVGKPYRTEELLLTVKRLVSK